MIRRTLYLFLAFAMLLALLPSAGMAEPVRRPESPSIYLRDFTFSPQTGELPAIPDELTYSAEDAIAAGYYIVQFTGPVQQEWSRELEKLGVELLDYIPDFAYKVRMAPDQLTQVQQSNHVGWVGVFQPAYKVSPEVKHQADTINLYRIRIEKGADVGQVESRVNDRATEIISRGGNIMVIAADARQVEAISRIADVAWIENYVLREKHNEFGGGVIIGANTAHANGYDGSTQTVAVADTGLGDGTANGAHIDIPASRIVAIYDWPGSSSAGCYTILGDGPQDVDSGHGTHTTASVLSDGSNGIGTGTAPAAKLVFQAVEDYADMSGFCAFLYGDGYYLLGLPDDIRDLLGQAYNAGARIHSDSWGSNVAGEYTTDAMNVDDFIWNHPDFLMTTSAGNAGVDGNSNGFVDEDSMGSPSTAKNLLTVGASENDRNDNFPCDSGLGYTSCANQGGVNDIFTYGSGWPADFPANPIANDPSAGNAEQLAAFSSRGPADDNRIKPDVVAPGTWILSGYSDLYQQGYDGSTNPQNNTWQYDGWGFPLTDDYKYMGGTSMSNPLVAGGAAVVRDFYQKAYGHAASAALTKATLINSAVDLLDENNDGANDNDYPIPNNHEGWGLVNLAAATDDSHQYVDDASGIGTGGSAIYQYNAGSGTAFKVSLVWSDYPSAETAARNLVNDLDLIVTAPGGAQYKGNVFSGGWAQTGGGADRTNNIENVYVQSPASGTWTVEVRGYNVPNGPQPFALVVDGNFGTPPPTPTDTPIPPTPTDTPVPPTPTDTPVPPTPTDTPVPPTPTDTPVATPTDTPVAPTPTFTPVPPTPTFTPVPPTPTPGTGDVIYISSSTGGNTGGVGFKDEDILAFDTNTSSWSMFFDGSDVGMTVDLSAFHIQSDGSILISFNVAANVPGVGSVDDSDIVRFIPTSTGPATSGTFELYFDGSDVDLTTNGEDVDSIGFAPDGRLIISTTGSYSVSGASGADEDLLSFSATSLGSNTAGTWAMYFDGSDVGLNTTADEDVWGVWIDAGSEDIYLTTRRAFSVSGVSGDGADIFVCDPASLGANTSCTFSLYWDGSANGFGSELADGIFIAR